MKRLLAILLSLSLLLSGCGLSKEEISSIEDKPSLTSKSTEIKKTTEVSFQNLSQRELLTYVEDALYQELVTELNSEEYFVENVEAIYYSKEYLEELEYNSKENIYFGYTLSELDACFEGERYVFTLGEDGTTTVQAFEEYDDTYERVLKNVVTGTGVILVCVTVSVVSGGTAPAVSMIFAASAKTGTAVALSSGVFAGATAGVVNGIETGDVEETLKSMALAGSDGFKWGAISGVVSGGVSEAVALKGATLGGLNMNQAAMIQKESKLPLEFIKNFHSVDEYNVYKTSGLQLTKVNGKYSYVQDIDWDFVDKDGKTNAERVMEGLAPVDSSGKSYELHHIGQKADSPLAVLTSSQHKGNYKILHKNTGQEQSEIDRKFFEKEKKEYWRKMLEMRQ